MPAEDFFQRTHASAEKIKEALRVYTESVNQKKAGSSAAERRESRSVYLGNARTPRARCVEVESIINPGNCCILLANCCWRAFSSVKKADAFLPDMHENESLFELLHDAAVTRATIYRNHLLMLDVYLFIFCIPCRDVYTSCGSLVVTLYALSKQ